MNACVSFLTCPVCGEELVRNGRSLQCTHGHSFDLAREGYVNLYRPGRKQPAQLGDSSAMLRARRRFLEAGHYAPLAEAVGALAADFYAGRAGWETETAVLDAGCGEGYYLGHVQAQLPGVCCFGLDVAKDAARLAARRYPQAHFIVADIWQQVPLVDGCVSVLLNIFAPRNAAAFARLTRPGALLLCVIPHPNHLANLREAFGLLEIENDKRQHVLAQLATHFAPVEARALRAPLHLDTSDLQALVAMMPSVRHLTAEQRTMLQQTPKFVTEAQFEILVLRRQQA